MEILSRRIAIFGCNLFCSLSLLSLVFLPLQVVTLTNSCTRIPGSHPAFITRNTSPWMGKTFPPTHSCLNFKLYFGFSLQPMETTMNLPYVGINPSMHLVYLSAMVGASVLLPCIVFSQCLVFSFSLSSVNLLASLARVVSRQERFWRPL